METIFEEPGEEANSSACNWLSHLRQRYKRSTYCLQDCIYLSICVLVSTVFSYSVISSNLLDVFFYFSKESESVASAYVFPSFSIFFIVSNLGRLTICLCYCRWTSSRLCLWKGSADELVIYVIRLLRFYISAHPFFLFSFFHCYIRHFVGQLEPFEG